MLALQQHSLLSITALALAAKVASTTLLKLASRLGPFDSSSEERWDTVYFLKIAREGYQYEQQAAFMPGLPVLMRTAGRFSDHNALLSGMVWSAIAGVGAALCLYKLTLELTKSKRHALLTTLLYLIPPSPPTAHSVPYTEPFAALATFSGMLLHVQQRDWSAALCWAVGSAFRAQGIVLGVGFFGWRYLLERPWRTGRLEEKTLLKGIPTFATLSLISALPFLAFQAWIHSQFCLGGDPRAWCAGSGLSYGWIQSGYWNVGPFRYWTLQQLPNFLLAAPVLITSFMASHTFYSHNTAHIIHQTLPFLSRGLAKPRPFTRPFLNPHLTPFIHLHTALTLLLLVASHTQIILRVCITNPVLWWFVADLLGEGEGAQEGEAGEEKRARMEGNEKRKRWGRRWVGYCVVWGSVSIVLWATFLPPA